MYPAMEKYLGEEGVRLSRTDKEQHLGVSTFLDGGLGGVGFIGVGSGGGVWRGEYG
jgi:hypothetical protein